MDIDRVADALGAGYRYLVVSFAGAVCLALESDAIQVPQEGHDLRLTVVQVMDLERCMEILTRMVGKDRGMGRQRLYTMGDLLQAAVAGSLSRRGLGNEL